MTIEPIGVGKKAGEQTSRKGCPVRGKNVTGTHNHGKCKTGPNLGETRETSRSLGSAKRGAKLKKSPPNAVDARTMLEREGGKRKIVLSDTGKEMNPSGCQEKAVGLNLARESKKKRLHQAPAAGKRLASRERGEPEKGRNKKKALTSNHRRRPMTPSEGSRNRKRTRGEREKGRNGSSRKENAIWGGSAKRVLFIWIGGGNQKNRKKPKRPGGRGNKKRKKKATEKETSWVPKLGEQRTDSEKKMTKNRLVEHRGCGGRGGQNLEKS